MLSTRVFQSKASSRCTEMNLGFEVLGHQFPTSKSLNLAVVVVMKSSRPLLQAKIASLLVVSPIILPNHEAPTCNSLNRCDTSKEVAKARSLSPRVYRDSSSLRCESLSPVQSTSTASLNLKICLVEQFPFRMRKFSPFGLGVVL
jgi:hypothetical protein